MNIIDAIKSWWNRKGNWPRDSGSMTTEEIKTEYRALYRESGIAGITIADDLRLSVLEAALRERGVYIGKGVDCHFYDIH